jgi:hypothetical protein
MTTPAKEKLGWLYLDYFTLPGNERYYEFVWGNAHLFAIDSDGNEPDGIASDSAQACWLKDRLAASIARWKIVYMHEVPYGSGALHGSTLTLRWPYRDWGANLVLSGHNHVYERVEIDGLAYVTNGLGGGPIHPFGIPVDGSLVRYNQDYGAGFIEVDANRLSIRFLAVDGTEVDELVLTKL